jgi:hypothetical protein
MRVCSSQLFLLASSLVTISSAISPGPERLETTVTTLERRATGEEHDPINVEIGCSNGEHCCNADCYTILCLGGPNPVQYGRGNATPNRENSGFSSNLLQVAQRTREAWGIFIADNILDRIGRSVEESIMVNTFQGGEGEISIPTQPDENMSRLHSIFQSSEKKETNIPFQESGDESVTALKQITFATLCGTTKSSRTSETWHLTALRYRLLEAETLASARGVIRMMTIR